MVLPAGVYYPEGYISIYGTGYCSSDMNILISPNSRCRENGEYRCGRGIEVTVSTGGHPAIVTLLLK